MSATWKSPSRWKKCRLPRPSRAKDRPNRLGVTVCRLLKVENNILYVQGLDAIDGTPVLDIKPVMRGFLPRGQIREPKWAGELMAGYWK